MTIEGLCFLLGYGAVLVVLPICSIIAWIRDRV